MPQVAVITGGSAGIWHATAMAFARAGYWVGVLARDAGRVEAVCEAIRTEGGHALGVPTDVADAAQVEHAADRIEHELGVISVWVNNASTTVFARVLDMTAEEYRRVTTVAYLGVVHGTLAALKRMHPRNRGVIIQTGSALAYRSIPLQSVYCAAKAAIRGFTDSLRCELIHDKSDVRITMVQPFSGPRHIITGNGGSAGRRSRRFSRRDLHQAVWATAWPRVVHTIRSRPIRQRSLVG